MSEGNFGGDSEDGELRSSSERRQKFVPGWGTGLGQASKKALLPSPLGPLHVTTPPSRPCPCARLQSSHSTIPQDNWGISQVIPVPDTCPVMSSAVQWPSLLLTSFWGSGSPSLIGDGKRGGRNISERSCWNALRPLGTWGGQPGAPSVEEKSRHFNPSRLESTEASGNFRLLKYLDSEMDGGAQGPEQVLVERILLESRRTFSILHPLPEALATIAKEEKQQQTPPDFGGHICGFCYHQLNPCSSGFWSCDMGLGWHAGPA